MPEPLADKIRMLRTMTQIKPLTALEMLANISDEELGPSLLIPAVDDSLPMSKREILERNFSDQRDYFRRHAAEVERVLMSPEFAERLKQIDVRSGEVTSDPLHWAHHCPERYREVLGGMHLWLQLIS